MKQRQQNLLKFLIGLILIALGVACSAPTSNYKVPAGNDEQLVAIEATSFAFAPNRIIAKAGTPLRLQVTNLAGSDHNLTIEDTGDRHLLEIALPAGETVTAELTIDQPGSYRIYCDKPLHPSLGMEGALVIE